MPPANPAPRPSTPGARRACRHAYVLAVVALVILAGGVAPAFAHPGSSSSPPLLPLSVRLKHQKSQAILALFARERLPASPAEHLPRAARSDGAESLLPAGVDALFQGKDGSQVVVVGTEAHPAELGECLRLLDVPVTAIGPDRVRGVLTLHHGDPARVREAALRLPEAGSVTVSGRQVTFEGTPAWLHRALRQVIRAELHQPATLALPAR